MIAEKLVDTLPYTAMRAPVADTGVANNVQESVGQPPFTLLSDSSTEELVKRISAKIEEQHKRDTRRNVMWSTFFFLLGIPVAIIVQHFL